MRPSVLDVGSDTQLLVVDAHPGTRPPSATSNQVEPRPAGSGGDLAQAAPAPAP